jgi:hypothetical protein
MGLMVAVPLFLPNWYGLIALASWCVWLIAIEVIVRRVAKIDPVRLKRTRRLLYHGRIRHPREGALSDHDIDA